MEQNWMRQIVIEEEMVAEVRSQSDMDIVLPPSGVSFYPDSVIAYLSASPQSLFLLFALGDTQGD